MGEGMTRTATRRIGGQTSASRAAMLDATERLMCDEGYAAVSTRRVAAEAGLKPSLVHYYFPTTEDLFVALYRRGAEQSLARLELALASRRPLHALWRYSIDQGQTAVALEFMALASHRKGLSADIGAHAERLRAMQAGVLERLGGSMPSDCPPEGLSLIMAGIARALVMEGGLGIASGHEAARQFVEAWIERIEPT